ncbi:uncharacterized protein BCR38DRAFT_498615 [Pseudomassariella vexata]|uniref:Glycan binding protein Y3-like domain-containing protein n=1 Tax=Pseudomassariella vexata TaxID=1141098 RepID=A0A1Y2DKP6_9PEZI|nr:uncharacterized protein BCR38DRAFT_498615 [Pseudomassariella vexata]ORY59759.1 hypothetical protein BCR38DRAFT_498615 [Pseudomassariella vexata]
MQITNLLTLALATGLVSAGCFTHGTEWAIGSMQAMKLATKFCERVQLKAVEGNKPIEYCYNMESHGWLAHVKFAVGHGGEKFEKVPEECITRMENSIKDCKHGGGYEDENGWWFIANPSKGVCVYGGRQYGDHNTTHSHHQTELNRRLGSVAATNSNL